MVRQITAGDAHVTTDADVRRIFPDHDASMALRAAELHASLLSRREQSDRIADLRERRRITAAEVKAAHEIALIVEWQTGEHQPIVRSQFSERLAATSGGCALWMQLMDAEAKHFAAWKRWALSYHVKRDFTLYALTLAIVAANEGVQQVANHWRMDRRRVHALLRRSLAHYACLAGFTNTPDPVEISP